MINKKIEDMDDFDKRIYGITVTSWGFIYKRGSKKIFFRKEDEKELLNILELVPRKSYYIPVTLSKDLKNYNYNKKSKKIFVLEHFDSSSGIEYAKSNNFKILLKTSRNTATFYKIVDSCNTIKEISYNQLKELKSQDSVKTIEFIGNSVGHLQSWYRIYFIDRYEDVYVEY